jgi:hypothetical protein
MANPVIVGTEVKAVGDADTKLIGLIRLTASTGLPYVMVNQQDNTYYQVPVGKKLCVIELTVDPQVTNFGNFTVYSGPTSNSSTGATICYLGYYQGYNNQRDDHQKSRKVYFEVPAGNYINVLISLAPAQINFIGIEMNA